MKKTLALLFFTLLFYQIQAQQEATFWYFGYNAGVDFSSGGPVAVTDGALRTDEGCATISDASGNLLFYTDGITIWNRNHDPMPNGTDLNGDPSSTQSAIIVPKSDEANIYYVFTVDDVGGVNGLQYNVIDMNLNGGLGDVTAEKHVQLQTPVSERITAVENTAGNGVWVITKSFGGNTFYSYLVDASGVAALPVVSSAGIVQLPAQLESIGYLKASSNGRFLASASQDKGYLELFRFNAASGVVSDPISFVDFMTAEWHRRQPYGLEFSSNSRVLYVSTKGGIYQFDISTYDQATILASGLLVSPLDSLPPFLSALQMGIDGKIYITRNFRNWLDVINNPNVVGMGCDYQAQVISLGEEERRGTQGLPPFITSFFYVGIEADHFCLGEATEFSVNVDDPITLIDWDFGDGNTSTLESPVHSYAAAGEYTVNVNVTTAIETTTETEIITIYEQPVANGLGDWVVHSIVPNPEINLSTGDAAVLGAQPAASFEVTYFANESDAQNNQNPLPNLYTTSLGTETLYARIQNNRNPDCYDTTSFNVSTWLVPELFAITDWTVCDTDEDGLFIFDLSQKDTEVYNGQDTSVFTVAYFTSQDDAVNNANALGTNYTNTAPTETLYYRIYNTAHPQCYRTGQFQIAVISGVTANTPTAIGVCDDDNDGFSTIDLSITEAEIVGAQNAATLVISYHPSLADAESNTNALNATAHTNQVAYNETIFVRVENNTDDSCYDTTSFSLAIFDGPVLQPITDWQVCDDDNDGRASFELSQKDNELLGGQTASDFTVTYYGTQADAVAGSNALSGTFTNTTNPQPLFYRVENNANPSCFLTDEFLIEVFNTPDSMSPSPLVVCSTSTDDGAMIDLSVKDMEVLNGQNPLDFEVAYFKSLGDAVSGENALPKTAYASTGTQETLYIRIQNINFIFCYVLEELLIRVNALPLPNLEDTYVICPDSPELTIDGGDFDRWSWRNDDGQEVATSRFFEVFDLGSYGLTVGQDQNGLVCENKVAFQVVSSDAPDDFTVAITGFSSPIDLSVAVEGSGTFEFSLDGTTFQDDHRFQVIPGSYTVYVRDPYLCRTLSKEVLVLGHEKFFTPNNDGTNEYWNVVGAENFPGSRLYVYDRYGKFLKQIALGSLGWDGTYLGVPMPAADYWFRFEKGDGTTFTGHFTLKR